MRVAGAEIDGIGKAASSGLSFPAQQLGELRDMMINLAALLPK